MLIQYLLCILHSVLSAENTGVGKMEYCLHYLHWMINFVLFFQVSTELPVRCLWSCLPLWWEWGMVYLSRPPLTMNRIKGFRRPRNISRVCPKNSASFLIAAHLDLAYTTLSELSMQFAWGCVCVWILLHHFNIVFSVKTNWCLQCTTLEMHL